LHYRSDAAHKPAFDRLMKLLDGHPLAIQAVLGGLAGQTPAEALAALEAGELGELPDDELAGKSRNVLASVHYAYSNVDPGAAALLACLAPFSGAVNVDLLPEYTEQLQAQPALAGLPFDRWGEALAAAGRWGLLEPHPIGGGYRRLQPIFPYFLRRRLGEDPERAEAVAAAFVAHYEGLGHFLAVLLQSKDAQERQVGVALTRVEFENLYGALKRALARRETFWGMFDALADYLERSQDHRARAALCAEVLAAREGYSAEQLASDIGRHYVMVLDRQASSNLGLKNYSNAERAYQQSLQLIKGLDGESEEWRAKSRASVLHQLGYIDQVQRQWAAAEGYYKEALAIKVAFDDRYSQASTLHQLGNVAQEQRKWAAAEGYYKEALAIKVAFDDRYSQASTLHQLGRVAEEQRQWAAAEGYYKEALAIFVAFDDRYHQGVTYNQLGTLAEAQEQWPQASAHYLQAVAIAYEFQDQYRIGTRMQNLARVWRASNDAVLLKRAGEVLGGSEQEVEALFRQVLEAGQGGGGAGAQG
jgi:tetratricopeptide (TPR) repeat protein